MSQGSGTPVEIDPSTYVGLFTGSEPDPAAFSGVCGRVVRGRSEAEFGSLAFASGRRLAWVTGPKGLRTMIGRTGAEIVLGVGKDPAWLRQKLAEGMRWRLIVLPQAACERAAWAGVFAIMSSDYPEVAEKLLRWCEALPDRAVTAAIDPGLVTGTVKDDAHHPRHMTVERYRSSADTALNARLFLWHSLGLNQHYVGDGWATDPLTGGRVEEYLTANVPLVDVAGHRVIELDVAQ